MRRTLRLIWPCALLALLPAPPGAAAAGDNPLPLEQRILDARSEGTHGPGFSQQSLQTLARTIRPTELSAVLPLLDSPYANLRMGASFALAAHCQAGLLAIALASKAPDSSLPQLDALAEALTLLEANPACPPTAQTTRTDLHHRIHSRREALLAAQRSRVEAENRRRQHLNETAIKMLDPTRQHEVSRADCEALALNSAAALGKSPAEAREDPLLRRTLENCQRYAP